MIGNWRFENLWKLSGVQRPKCFSRLLGLNFALSIRSNTPSLFAFLCPRSSQASRSAFVLQLPMTYNNQHQQPKTSIILFGIQSPAGANKCSIHIKREVNTSFITAFLPDNFRVCSEWTTTLIPLDNQKRRVICFRSCGCSLSRVSKILQNQKTRTAKHNWRSCSFGTIHLLKYKKQSHSRYPCGWGTVAWSHQLRHVARTTHLASNSTRGLFFVKVLLSRGPDYLTLEASGGFRKTHLALEIFFGGFQHDK